MLNPCSEVMIMSSSMRRASLLGLPLVLMAALALGEDPPADPALVPGSDDRVTMYRADAQGQREALGTIVLRPMKGGGLRLIPDLQGLPPGEHGFHIHHLAQCQPGREEDDSPAIGQQAGPHLDPTGTDRHAGPGGGGHLGDLPRLQVDEQGRATVEVEAPHVSLKDVVGRALVIDAGGDAYDEASDSAWEEGHPIACGIISPGPLRRPGADRSR